MELGSVGQRYEAVNEVVRHNLPVTEVAARYGVARLSSAGRIVVVMFEKSIEA